MPKAKGVIWAPAAEHDLLEIWGYYAHVGSADIADNVLRGIKRSAEAIGENPLLSRDRSELLPGLRSVVVQPHVIFFLIQNDVIEIARVLHGRRDFPAIFARQ